jgi:hypothetical protein
MDSKTHRYAKLIQLSDAAHSYVTRRNETGRWERPTSHALVYPRTVSTDVDGFRLLAAFGEAGQGNPASAGTGSEWWGTPAWSCRQEEASGQQIEPGPAEHLTLQHLQAVDMPFNGALTPR